MAPGLLEKEVPGYAWYEALTNPSNWVGVGGLILALISLLVQGVQHYWLKNHQGETGSRTAVGVTITNALETAPQWVYMQGATQPSIPPIYGVIEVIEENELVPMGAAPILGKWKNPILPELRRC